MAELYLIAFIQNPLWHMKTNNDSLFLVGRTDSGTLYAAYEFLEKTVGVKFLAFDYTYIPKVEEIFLYEIDKLDEPALNDRAYLSNKVMTDGMFASRMRMVNEFVNIEERYGGNLAWFKDTAYIDNYVHNTLCYVPPKLYYESHPEWYFVDEGQIRDVHYSNLGLTENGAVDESLEISPVKVAIENMKHFVKNADSSIKYFMLGQEDVNYTCQCPLCKAQEKKYKRSGMNIRFLNAVSDKIVEWMNQEGIEREIYFCTFAYQWSQSAPVDENGEPLDETVIPRDNVIIRIAPIQANNYYGLLDMRQNERTRKMFEEWLNVAKRTMVWSYHMRATFLLAYYPTIQHWQEDLELYMRMGGEYIMMQSDHCEPNDWRANMETYVASKMLWNPKLDPFAIRQEYISLYYNEISDLVTLFIDNFEDNFKKVMNFDEPPNMTLQGKSSFVNPKYYTTEFFDEQLGLIEKMRERIKNENILIERRNFLEQQIDRLSLTPMYMLLYFYDEYYSDGAMGKERMMKTFFDTCDKLGVKKVGEWQTLGQLKENKFVLNDGLKTILL